MRLGLALSGGGFRATLFHLGVIQFLSAHHLLEEVTDICSVSGGSVLAAHLVQHWDLYNDADPQTFGDRAAQIVQFVQRDMRGWILRRFLSFYPPTRLPLIPSSWKQAVMPTAQLERFYANHLYGNVSMGQLASVPQGRPYLHILTTNLTNFGLCSFTQDGFSIDFGDRRRADDRPRLISTGRIPVARAVAASSAFPGMFPPLVLRSSDEDFLGPTDETEFEPSEQRFTDGGVFDNLGIRKFQQLIRHRLGHSLLREEDLLDRSFLKASWHEAREKNELASSQQPICRRIRELLAPLIREVADELVSGTDARRLILYLNQVLSREDFYQPADWEGIAPLPEAQKLLADPYHLPQELHRANRLYLEAAFPNALRKNAGTFDLIVVSDAQLPVQREMRPNPFFLVSVPLRATDIFMHRINTLEQERIRERVGECNVPFRFVSITNHRLSGASDTYRDLAKELPYIRTDFDYFSDVEILRLVQHGYLVAASQLRNLLRRNQPLLEWIPPFSRASEQGEPCGATLDKPSADKPLPKLARDLHAPFNPRDPRTWGDEIRHLFTRWKARRFALNDTLDEKALTLREVFDRKALRQSARRRPGLVNWKDPVTWGHCSAGLLLIGSVIAVVSWLLLRQPAPVETWEPTVKPQVYEKRFEPLDYNAFEVKRHALLIDLQRWVPVPTNEMTKRRSPTFWTRHVYLSRKPDEAANHSIRFQWRSTGSEVYLRCLKFPHTVRVSTVHENVGPHDTTVWEIEIDVSSVKEGRDFDLEVEAITWNDFTNMDREGAGFIIYPPAPTEEASLWVFFPGNKPYKSYERLKYPTGERVRGQPIASMVGEDIAIDRSNLRLHWRIFQPEVGHMYEIEWEW